MKSATAGWQEEAPRERTDRSDGTGAGAGAGALDKALDLLDAIGDAPNGMSQTELADRVGLPRTTVYRLLASLVDRGLLRRDPLRRVFCLGFRCFEMARKVYAMSDLVSAAAVELRMLRDLTGETAYLAALEGNEVIGLERVDGAHSQRSQAVLGQRKPVYCTSQGKAILSAMDAPSRDAIVRELTLKPLTPLTITDRRRLQAELKITAARGYAIDNEEIVMGVRCVGAPIVDGEGQVRGAISVAGPAYRLTPERLDLLGPELAEAARRIGAQLQAAQAPKADPSVQVIDGAWAFHGAHPRWSTALGALVWADVLAPSLHVAGDAGDRVAADAAQPIAGVLLREGTVWLLHRDGAGILDGATLRPIEPDARWPTLPLQASCDGADGVIWAAIDISDGYTAIGTLSTEGRFQPRWRVAEPVQCLRWHAAEGLLYATAPRSGTLLMLQPGQPSLRRLATVPKGSGRISGLAFDAHGGVWTALCDGWSVVRFTADGTLERVIGLPVPCPTDVEIGGPDLDRLYVTSARHSVALDALQNAPLSGRLFMIDIV